MQAAHFLLMRSHRLFREFRTIGWLYSLILLLAVAALFYLYYRMEQTGHYQVPVAVSVLVMVAAVHWFRDDHVFVGMVASQPFYIYFAEYTAVVLPFILLSILASGEIQILGLIPAVCMLALVPVRTKRPTLRLFTGRLVPMANYEWKAGMRKSGVILILLWITALVLAGLPFVTVIIMWFFLLVVSSFYDEGESREMVESYRLAARPFLRKKLRGQVMQFMTPVLPVMVVTGLFWPDRWWVFLLFILFAIVNVAVFVVSKYAVWRPADVNRSNGIVNAMCMMGMFLPFLLPLPAFVFFRNYRKAVNNLDPLLHDYHN